MRVAVLQTAPVLGAVEQNIARATALLAALPPSQLDLIVLPELAFTGYSFQAPKDITPFVETKSKSPSREWAVRIAKEYRCSVLVGLPTQDENRHNAAVMVDSTGGTIHEYYKHHMYETDYKWGCTAGPGFSFIDFPVDGVPKRTSIGICMDLNPWEFRAPFNAFEYANYILENDINLILIPMAWLDPRTDPDDPQMPSHGTLNYWIERLKPLITDEKPRTVVICNRTGEEETGAVYAGTSCAVRLGGGGFSILGLMGKEEGVLTVNLEL